MDKYTKFEQIYANLPLQQRSEIIVVLGNEPLTWNVAWVEVSNKTKKGEEILKKLELLKII